MSLLSENPYAHSLNKVAMKMNLIKWTKGPYG